MTHQIPYDSPNGKAIKAYFDRCENADQAANQFVRGLGSTHPTLGFPLLTDEQAAHVSIVTNDSNDAGGLMAIALPASIADQLSIDPDLWVKVSDPAPAQPCAVSTSPAADPIIMYCPRLTIASYDWLRYRDAALLFDGHASDPAYRFEVETNPRSKQYKQPRLHVYSEVKHSILPDNRRRLLEEGRGPVTDQTRLALVTTFALRPDYDPATPSRTANTSYQTIADVESVILRGRALYDLIEELPVIPANEMLRILQLRMPTSARRGFTPSFEYKADDENQQYIIHTNLVSPIL